MAERLREAYEQDHVLPDGTTVHLRPIEPEDADLLLEMWERLSKETVYRRFHGGFRLTEDNVDRFVDLDPDCAFALVATLGRGEEERIVGVCRFVRESEGSKEAEFAEVVEDAHQGRGIGTALLRHLVPIAREQGIERLTGDVLRENDPMLRVVRDLGLSLERHSEGITVHTVFQLEPTEEFLEAVAADEKKAAVASLDRFFKPESIAVVGASRDPDSIGGLLFSNLIAGAFTGVVYPVNPATKAVQAVAAYPSLSELPEVPDLVLVCVPADEVAGVIDEAGELGVKAAVIISAGFAEKGEEGARRQAEVLQRARAHGMRIVGPNCMGLLNGGEDVRLNATFSRLFPSPGRVAFSSQSGALGLAALAHLDQLGLGISNFISVGNKADISGNDLLLYWEDDPDTEVVLLYLESFGNSRRFSRIARRISYKKPLVVVKSGRTPAGRRATTPGAARAMEADLAVDALFRQTGVIRTETLEELFDVASLLGTQPLPRGRRVAIVTNASGPGVLCADACEANGLHVPPFSHGTLEKLQEVLGREAKLDNPLDMTAAATALQYANALRVVGEAPEFDATIVIFIPPFVVSTQEVAREIVAARRDLPAQRPVLSVFMNVRGLPDELREARIPSYSFPEDAARALGRVAGYAHWRSLPPGDLVRPDGLRPDDARDVVKEALERSDGEARSTGASTRGRTRRSSPLVPRNEDEGVWLGMGAARQVLEAYGIDVADFRIVGSAEEGRRAYEQLDGPVAVKVASHIRTVGVDTIRLGLEASDEVATAITEMQEALRGRGLQDHAASFLVQEMVPDGVEMVVGVTHDRSFGPLLTARFGGPLVELLQDVSVRVTPITDVDADEMLRALKAFQLLTGDSKVDVEALKDLLFRVNAMVDDLPQIAELDLNPVFVRETGPTAAGVQLRVAHLLGGIDLDD